MKIAIIVINFNCSDFLTEQIKRIRQYVAINSGDSLDILVCDNSNDQQHTNTIKNICQEAGIFRVRYIDPEGDSSRHHAGSLNFMFSNFSDKYDIILFMDHDIFPFAHSSLLTEYGNKYLAGLAQTKHGKKYMHPALLMINVLLIKTITEAINFMPFEHYDTGGELYKIIDAVGEKQVAFLETLHPEFQLNGKPDFYEVLDGTFMHFIKGSNWNGDKDHADRITHLFGELETISR